MTVPYREGIRLLTKWKGSVWRAVWKHLLIWLCLYYFIRFLLFYSPMNDVQRSNAIAVIGAFDRFCDKIPVSFLLGFYVMQVVSRWWNQISHLTWPDEIMTYANAYFPKPEDKYLRQTLARWLILCQTMVFRRISIRIRRRFPKLDTLIEAGLLNNQEIEIIRNTKCINNRWQLPLQWMMNKIIIPSDLAPPFKNNFLASINKFGDSMRMLYLHDWIGVPLVYAQSCTAVVYGYFIFCAIGHQYFGQPVDLYVPWLTILQLIFFQGWLQVAQDLMRPFGEDDDDVELNCMLDRNAAVAINLASQIAEENPDLVEDSDIQNVFVEKMMNNMAYSRSALEKYRDRPPKMYASVQLKDHEREMIAKLEEQVNIPIKKELFQHVRSYSSPEYNAQKMKKPSNLF